MLYVRSCFDKPGHGDVRDEFRTLHREYLKPFVKEGNTVRIVMGGPICISDTDDTNLGSFMIIEAPSIGDVQMFHNNDPFTVAGIFDRVEIVRWKRHIG